MADWVVPVEHETGIPLAIMPHANGLPPAGQPGLDADFHHAIYPKSREELLEASGFAVRESRLEWVDQRDHNSYHYFFDEYIAEQWKFPETTEDRLGMVVMMAARYVPPDAVRITRNGPSYAKLDEPDRQKMWDSGILKIASESVVYEFLREQVLQQDVSTRVTESEIEQFLTTDDSDVRNRLGNLLLDVAADMATGHIRPVYLEAYRNRLILPGTAAEPKELIVNEPFLLGTAKRRRKARTEIRRRLAVERGIAIPEAA